MEFSYTIQDYDYRTAVNCEHTQYVNPPITVTVDDVKYILPFGTTDKRISQTCGEVLEILAINKGLGYAYLARINVTEQSCITGDCDNMEAEFFDMELTEQIRYMYNYMPY